MSAKILRMHTKRALQVAGGAKSIEEAIAVFQNEMETYESLQCAGKTNNLGLGLKIIELRSQGDLRRPNGCKLKFTPERGDFVRGMFRDLEGVFVPGIGVVNNENIASVVQSLETSVVAAKGWINREDLTREIPNFKFVAQILEVVG